MKNLKKVLVVDDEESLRIVLRNALRQKGFEVDSAKNGKEALTFLDQNEYGAALVDIRMPEMNGFELLTEIKKRSESLPVIMMTAQDTMKHAVDAMKFGAFDYIAKPFDINEVEALVEKGFRETHVIKEDPESLDSPPIPDTIVGISRPIREIYKMIGKLAARDVTALIQGESGTGKELIARAIHAESSRGNSPFVPVNLAAIPKELLESELFGHVRGSFTGATGDHVGYFERAGEGTLFLDEIGEMPLSLQVKLLRVLQEREIQRVGSSETIPVRARIIAATNQDLEKMVKEKRFREDLFYRLHVVPLVVPSLRIRREDIPVLANHFVRKFCKELACPIKRISPEIMKGLKMYNWPGNVRELENVIKRAIVLSPGATLLSEIVLPQMGDSLEQANVEEIAIEEIVRKKLQSFLSKWEGFEVTDLHEAVIKRVERPLIELILTQTRGNQVRAAKMLGINRNTLFKKMKDLGIQPRST